MKPDHGQCRRLTHLDESGAARMVDVSAKNETSRRARAEAFVVMSPETLEALLSGNLKKGDAFAVARIAGIMAAKKTPDLVPLCHPIRLDSVSVNLEPAGPGRVRIEAECAARDVTGVEMEAITACSVAAVALYDMIKSADRGAFIEKIRLLEKSGGKSGTYRRGSQP